MHMLTIRYLFTCSCIALLLGCTGSKNAMTVPQKGHPAMNNIQASLHEGLKDDKQIQNSAVTQLSPDISSALLPNLSIQARAAQTEQYFDYTVKDVPAREFFLGLVKGSHENIIVSPEITGTITLNLKHVTISQVLAAVHDLYGYQYLQMPYGYRIFPAGMHTQVFKVNYLNVIRKGKSHTLVNSGQVEESSGSSTSTTSAGVAVTGSDSSGASTHSTSSTVETETTSDFWKALQSTLQTMVSKTKGSDVVVNETAGVIVVTSSDETLAKVTQYLDVLQTSINREVLIDAKILEVNLYAGYQAGIDWNILGLSQNSLGKAQDGSFAATGNSEVNDSLQPFSNVFTLNITDGNAFNVLMKLLSTQGNVQVLSSPRISTLNNQKAVIKVGSDEFFVTNISNTTVSSTSTQNTQNVDIAPFFSGVALDVTPEISNEGEVTLHIHPIVSTVRQHDITYTVGGTTQEIPSALTQVRESDTIVRAKNGQVVVIGGLMEDITSEVIASTPFLGDAPIIGPLFRRTNQQSVKTELVILLQPTIMNDQALIKQLHGAEEQFNALNKGYMYGSHPDVFGNLGEPSIQKKLAEQTME